MRDIKGSLASEKHSKGELSELRKKLETLRE